MNKASSFIFYSFFFFILNFHAQKQIGLKAGVNFSKYSGELFLNSSYKYNPGFYFGGFAEFSVNKNLKIKPEVFLSQQGSKFVEERDIDNFGNTINDEVIFEANFIEERISVPIILKYLLSKKMYFELGPQIDFILTKDENIKKNKLFEGASFLDTNYDDLDFGIASGFGYELNNRIILNFRGFFGLKEKDSSNIKSSVLNLGIEYIL